MSIRFLRRLAATSAAGAVLGLGALAPVAGRAATPMGNGCHVMAPSTVSCRYVARGNGSWMSATSSPWIITVLHEGRLRAVANRPSNGSTPPATMGTFPAAAGDIVTVRFDDMVPVGMVEAGDA